MTRVPDDIEADFLRLLTRSSHRGTAEAAEEVLNKWTFDPNQSRVGGRFASGTGGNQHTAQPRQPAMKPINAAAAANTAGSRPVNPAAARITPPASTGAQAKPAVAPSTTPQKPAAQQTGPTIKPGDHNGGNLTLTHRSTTLSRERDSQQRAKTNADIAHGRQELAKVRAALASHKDPTPLTQAQVNKAVDAMCKKYGIPKSVKGLSRKQRAAVAAMKSTFRAEVRANAREAKYQSRADAIKKQLKAAKTPAARAYLQARLNQAQAQVKATQKQQRALQKAFKKARKQWHR